MAPSSRPSRRQQTKQQPTLSSFSRISKSAVVNTSTKPKPSAAKELALKHLENEREARLAPQTPAISLKAKRKRGDTDSEDGSPDTVAFFSSTKRAKIQLPTPPRSPSKPPAEAEPFPAEAQQLISIFSAFCKAFALHRAHNGTSTPAELTATLESVTRLYQKRTVVVDDLQTIFGVFEQRKVVNATKEVQHQHGPFKLRMAGLGSCRRYLIEFVGYTTAPRNEQRSAIFSEQDLQSRFQDDLSKFLRGGDQSVRDIPLLSIEIGNQTTIRQHKAKDTLNHIMAGRKSDLSMDNLSISDPNEAPASTIKSRTLSLFDRVKAKQLANSGKSAPSADILRRKHAMARLAEVVEILRMKQQQKLHGYHGAAAGGKVSFAIQQVVSELKASMVVPMGEDEIKLCLEILAKEVKDGWCSIIELGATKSVVLVGTARSAQEMMSQIQP